MKEVVIPGYIERLDMLEQVVDGDKVIIDQLKKANKSLLEADIARGLEVKAHQEIEGVLRKDNKKLRRKLKVTKLGSGAIILGLGIFIISQQIN